MMTLLAQSNPTTEAFERLREGFNQEGGWGGWIALFSVALVPILVIAAGRCTRLVARWREGDRPGPLFARLLRDLGFTSEQRRLLSGLAADLRLEHPAVMLLSPELFREHVNAWIQKDGRAASVSAEKLATIAQRLSA